MKKFFKHFGIGLAILVGSFLLGCGGYAAWKFFLSTLEGWGWAFLIVAVVMFLIAFFSGDSDAGVFFFMGVVCIMLLIIYPRTGQKRIECLEWSEEKRREVKTHSDGTQYYEPPQNYCVIEQQQIRIDGNWKEVKNGI